MLTNPLFHSRITAAAVVLATAAALGGCAATQHTGQPAQHSAASANASASTSTALDVTTLNGERPPGRLARLVDAITMLDAVDVNGQRIVVEKGIRKAGTRVGIHVHEYGGHTCVLSGEITGFMQGHAPQKWPAGTCYYMPPNMLMAAANLGTEDVELIDTFLLPPGKPTITIREPGFPSR